VATDDKYGRLKQLMEVGKEKGFVLYDEVNELLTEDFTSGREFEDLLTDLDSAGVEILEEPKLDFEKKEEPDDFGDLELAQDVGDKTNDPVRMYLREMGTVPLLTREGEIELYAEGETRRQISTLNMTEALRAFFGLRHPQGYIALLPFVGFGDAQKIVFRRIRERLESTLGLPVLVTPGPNYLHAIGQVYKGGPAKGLFLLLTASPVEDLAIPGAEYSFGQLQLALALGEFESLGHRQRHVIRLHLARGAEPGLIHLEAVLNNALGKSRFVAP
jgi:hypothetical protein